MVRTTTLGFPRIGRNRELKQACESYWKGAISEEELRARGAELRYTHWRSQLDAGIDLVPVNDFSLYDQVLDAIALIGAIPERYQWDGEWVDLDTYFALARGAQQADLDVKALEMTKWFDTNYHYLVPEWYRGQRFCLASSKVFDEFAEALAHNIPAKPVLIGPLSLVLLGKVQDQGLDVLDETLAGVTAVYGEVIARLASMGARWIQLDEPCLVQDRTAAELAALRQTYEHLATYAGEAKLIVATYFGSLDESYETVVDLPVAAIGLDLVAGRANLELLRRYGLPETKTLIAGVVDGRNIWRNDLSATLTVLDEVLTVVPRERLIIAPSCSLLHVPYDARRESGIVAEVQSWLAFAEQKVQEVVTLGESVHSGRQHVASALAESDALVQQRATSPLVHNAAVQERLAGLQPPKRVPYAQRQRLQAERLKLPILPTTTIGSFPQTSEVRQLRQRFTRGQITLEQYEQGVERFIADALARQEALGLDMLVHGEFERNDMVQYFGEQLAGFAFTHDGWVQSYGSRYVRPPIIYGDVARPAPLTVRWCRYAQSLTSLPVKGMLTGPVTMLQWSFVRDDQPRSATCRQIALALQDEVRDLAQVGIRAIQVDEPALREGLPLRRQQWDGYLAQAIANFQITIAGAGPETQIHTHMCYSDFNDCIEAISALDADVISLENSRSDSALLEVFSTHSYKQAIGPGVYDIHSPRVPSVAEITAILQATLKVFPARQVWVNPDCGLKTRTWDEVIPALQHMVSAAHELRKESSVSLV